MRIWRASLTLLCVVALGFGWVADGYLVDLVAIALLFGLFAASVDLSWGYCGVLNLGPALYFGIGCYFMAYGLKADWGLYVSLGAAMMCTLALASVVGYVGFRIRSSFVQFGLIGLVLSLGTRQIMIGLYDLAGGSNGITNVPRPSIGLFFTSLSLDTPQKYFYFICVMVALSLAFLHWCTNSHYGKILVSVRQDPDKAEALGYNHRQVKLSVSLLSAIFGTLAGALYVPISGIAHPELFGVTPNMLVLVWVAIGGQGTLYGPFVCALGLKLVESELGSQFENYYVLIVGAIFVLTVLFRPEGVAGLILRLKNATESQRRR